MKHPSIRQIRAFQLINQGMSKRGAMIQAGYKISSANQAKRILRTQSMKIVKENFVDELANVGLTTEYLAWKLKELMEATKQVDGVIIPDYKIQLDAFHQCFEILKQEETDIPHQSKRKLTIEEWVNQEN